MNVNYLGAVFCTRAALPGMKARKKGLLENESSLFSKQTLIMIKV